MNRQTAIGTIKIGMIPFLLGILYFVFPGKPSTPDGIAAEQKKEPTTGERIQSSEDRDTIVQALWPEFHLGDLENVNPFDRSMIFPELSKTVASDAMPLDRQSLVAINSLPAANKLEALKVQAVFQSPQGIAALVGDRVIHIGDLLEDGTQVIEITPEQLVVSMIGVN